MSIKNAFIVIAALVLVACGEKKGKISYDTIGAGGLTARTENLQSNLFPYQEKGVMIGQAYGTTTAIGEVGDSVAGDIYKMAGDRPACIGFELKGIESGKKEDIHSIPFDIITRSILNHFKKQGLVVLSWTVPHCKGNEKIIKLYAGRVARYISSLQDGYAIKVPVVLVLYPLGHGEWYDSLSADEYKKMYGQTVGMLRADTLTNAIFAFSNSLSSASAEEFMRRCPEENIDVVQLDALCDDAANYLSLLTTQATKLSVYCNEHMKAFGIYGGVKGLDGNRENFLTDAVLPVLQSVKMSYFMFGQNKGSPADGFYYLPFTGSKNVNDFMNIYNDRHTIFLRDLNGLLVDRSKKQN